MPKIAEPTTTTAKSNTRRRLDPRMARAYAAALRPAERLSPSAFAVKYRNLKEGTTARPGRWTHEDFEYLTPVMDSFAEAILLGKRGFVLMKSGQGGGSEAIINCVAWQLTTYPGPTLYLISKDEVAREFARERFSYINETCAPLKRKHLTGRGSGELVHVKRYVDGKLVVQGGRSVLNLQSQPYRFIYVDEIDSLLDEVEGHGDLMKLVQVRTDAFPGDTLITAFAHPSTRERGAGKLYYEQSDQRRGFVCCPHCDEWFWLQWAHVSATPRAKETQDRANRNPARYAYHAPCCGAEVSDAQRVVMVRGVEQRPTLPASEARTKPWIGVHFSQLYMPNKPLALLAERYVDGLKDESSMRVFVNKTMGDVYEPKIKQTSPETWRLNIRAPRAEGDAHSYLMGTVPPSVSLLTAGQDSRETELHWSVWGWGLVRNASGFAELCGWLIDAGVVQRQKSPTLAAADLQVFDQLLYDRAWPRTDGSAHLYVAHGYHDEGWQPIAIRQYCATRRGRAYPAKGDAVDSSSRTPPHRWGAQLRYVKDGVDYLDKQLRTALLNTFKLKEDFFGLIDKSFALPAADGARADTHTRITLPTNVPDEYIQQSASEYLALHKRRHVWKHKGPNHWSDTNIYAYAAALNLDPFQAGLPFDEAAARAESNRENAPAYREAEEKNNWKIGRN